MLSQKSKKKLSHNIDAATTNTSITFEAIGTNWKIDVPLLIPHQHETLLAEIKQRISEFDSTYSRFQADSWVTTISKKPGTYTLPQDAQQMFDVYSKLYDLSDGVFTPLVGNLLEQAGYDSQYSLIPGLLTKPHRFEDVVTYTSTEITLHKPLLLDFGACGKGYLIDQVAGIFKKHDITFYCIDGSGDIYYHDAERNPLRVGLEHPDNANQIIGITSITNESICASAGNRRTWEGFHHIINPHTLTSPKDILATWVVSKTTITADALATCLFLTPPEKLANDFAFEYLILYADYTVKKSERFKAELYYN